MINAFKSISCSETHSESIMAVDTKPTMDSTVTVSPNSNSNTVNTATSSALNNKLAAVPQELVIRSLRRRFFYALFNEDHSLALRLYRSTRADWELILQQEATAWAMEHHTSAATKSRDKSKQSKRLLDNIPVFKKQRSGWTGRRVTNISSNNDALGGDTTAAILPEILKPCDFFVEDDYLHPFLDPYHEFAKTSSVTGNLTASATTTTYNNSNVAPNDNRRFGWFRRSSSSSLVTGERTTAMPDTNTIALLNHPPQDAERRTTPLHEAARIGNGKLVRFLLEWTGGGEQYDINVKNGIGRTPLHCVAGGLTKSEATRVQFQDEIAILAPPRYSNVPQDRARARFWSRRFAKQSQASSPEKKLMISIERWKALEMDRLDAGFALLTAEASTNSVDQHGRTALHYSAALGRDDMTMAFFNSFGTLLTIVDGFSRTPAEWAALHGHKSLAAQLEARALLYMDPLDMDLLESIQEQNAEQSGGRSHAAGSLSPPFAWFTTFSIDRVQKEREFRIQLTLDRMKKILERLNGGKSARDILSKLSFHSRQSNGNSSNENSPSSSSSLSDSSPSPSPLLGQNFGSLEGIHEGQVSEFLTFYDWDVKKALAAFYEDPVGSFTQKKIGLPKQQKIEVVSRREVCLICCEEFDTSDSMEWMQLECLHGFCVSCLGDYVSDCAKSRLSVHCPHHECTVALSNAKVSELAPTEEVREIMTEIANNNFVVKSRDFRFCPHPGCSNVVKFLPPKNKGVEVHDILMSAGAVCCSPESHAKRKEDSPFITYEGMYDEEYFDCQSTAKPFGAHRFCFHCGENAHWPVDCQRLEQWKATVEEHVKDVQEEGDEADYNDVSYKLWIKANTRPCPKCKAPIQKQEGCNHVTCSNPHCKHEFCWICRNDWSLHGTSTGGFFRCNRWADDGQEHQFYDKAPSASELRTPTDEDLSDPRRMRVIYGTAMHESRVAYKRSREMARFLHHYQRFSAHADSAELESKMAESCPERLKPIVQAAIEFSGEPAFNFGGKGLSFIFDAFAELVECRSVLQHSYAFSFFRYSSGNKSSRNIRRKLAEALAFEQMQAELEMMTEQMSDLVARSHMRATQSQILYMTLTAAQKRRDFSSFMMRVIAKEREEQESSEGDLSDGSGGGTMDHAIHHRAFRPIHVPPGGESTLVTGLARNEGNRTMELHQGAFFGETVQASIDPAFEASLRAFRENSGAMDLLHLNTSYDSQNVASSDDGNDDDDDSALRNWSCEACTFINSHGRACLMCGTPHSQS